MPRAATGGVDLVHGARQYRTLRRAPWLPPGSVPRVATGGVDLVHGAWRASACGGAPGC
ncbi:TPA: hypothetical protein I8510_004571, partial [Aeromonas hydrophila]|nr:hypothetical protein [Aeromonas hydrophila]